jgi:dTDP-4-amino-4,6-dideoxygalactose transaminase
MNRESKLEPYQPPLLVLRAPQIDKAGTAEVVTCLLAGWFETGLYVGPCERSFPAFYNLRVTRVSVANSFEAALHVSMRSMGGNIQLARIEK